MAGEYDFVVAGSSTLSLLLCGLLARDHGARVARLGRQTSPERLPRGPDLAFLGATRADNWRVLRNGDAETRRLLAAIGIGTRDVDVEIIADTERTLAAFDHIAHMAAGYRQAVRGILRGWRFGGVTLVPPQAEKLVAWLERLGVAFIDADESPLAADAEGSARVTGVEAGAIVLADDDFILELDESQRPQMLQADTVATTLLEHGRRRSRALRFYPDRSVALIPRDPATLLARVRHDAQMDDRLASVLDGPFPMRRLATARYRVLSSLDGAPVIGRLNPTGLFFIAGLEEAAAFFAPALARVLKGRATAGEVSWFASHGPTGARAAVAEFVL